MQGCDQLKAESKYVFRKNKYAPLAYLEILEKISTLIENFMAKNKYINGFHLGPQEKK